MDKDNIFLQLPIIPSPPHSMVSLTLPAFGHQQAVLPSYQWWMYCFNQEILPVMIGLGFRSCKCIPNSCRLFPFVSLVSFDSRWEPYHAFSNMFFRIALIFFPSPTFSFIKKVPFSNEANMCQSPSHNVSPANRACAVEPCVAALLKATQWESTPMTKKWFGNTGGQPFLGLVC